MGVRGLRSFIQENRAKFLQDVKLKDTKLVIDGSNLLYFLNSHFEDENIYGGNYDHFSTRCRDFFNSLLKCNITPIVVFDGADDPHNMKLETALKRLDERFRKVNKWEKTEEVLPILSESILYQILDELKVPHIATVYEADEDIAVLANRYECPVLTNDSDFYVYDLKGGSISMACMVEKERTDVNGRFYLPVKLYKRDVVVKELFQIENDEYIFPVFATLTGNDFFDNSSVIITYPKRPRDKMIFAKKNIRIVKQFMCDAEFESGKAAYDHIYSQLAQEQRQQFKFSIDSYLDIKEFTLFDLEAFIDGLDHDHSGITHNEAPITIYERNQANTELHNTTEASVSFGPCPDNKSVAIHNHEDIANTYENAQVTAIPLNDFNGKKLPLWFVHRALKCEMECTFLLNISQNHRLLFKAQPESHERPSSFRCAESVRRVIYMLVLNNEGNGSHTQPQQQRMIIHEYHRQRTDLAKVKPMEKLDFISELPRLETIPSLPKSERKVIVYATFKARLTSFGQEIDETSEILILMLSLWMAACQPRECHVNSILIGIISLHALSSEGSASSKCLDISNAIENVDKDEIENFKDRFDKYFKNQGFMARHGINKEFVHKMSQFQAIFLDTHHLNKLLLNPVNMPSPSVVLNSTFNYNMCHLLENNVSLKNIFRGEKSTLYCLLKKWQHIIEERYSALKSHSAVGKKKR